MLSPLQEQVAEIIAGERNRKTRAMKACGLVGCLRSVS